MADAEWKKAELWADTGDREDPEGVGIDRSVGWTVSYEQRGSGDEPERTVFNQLLRELSGWAVDQLRMGVLQWDEDVDYVDAAFVTTEDGLHVALQATGPGSGNATDPTATQDADDPVWRIY